MATWLHERPQPLPVSATPQVWVSSFAPPAQLMDRGRGVLVLGCLCVSVSLCLCVSVSLRTPLATTVTVCVVCVSACMSLALRLFLYLCLCLNVVCVSASAFPCVHLQPLTDTHNGAKTASGGLRPRANMWRPRGSSCKTLCKTGEHHPRIA